MRDRDNPQSAAQLVGNQVFVIPTIKLTLGL
jgi:hypothetical protein